MEFVFLGFVAVCLYFGLLHISDRADGKAAELGFRPNRNRD
jgi:hypothetical protein